MVRFNIILTDEHLHGLFTSDGRDELFARLLGRNPKPGVYGTSNSTGWRNSFLVII